MIRTIWRAASRPQPFFEKLKEAPPNLLYSSLAAMLSVSFALVALAFAIIVATASTAYAPIVLGLLLAGLFYWLLIWALGGLVIIRPASLDIRGWEIVAWSWVPAGVVALSLIPVVFIQPLIAIFAGVFGVYIWHIGILSVALGVFAEKGRVRAMIWYIGCVMVLPWLMFGAVYFGFWATGVI
jgi:hypothetical protein